MPIISLGLHVALSLVFVVCTTIDVRFSTYFMQNIKAFYLVYGVTSLCISLSIGVFVCRLRVLHVLSCVCEALKMQAIAHISTAHAFPLLFTHALATSGLFVFQTKPWVAVLPSHRPHHLSPPKPAP